MGRQIVFYYVLLADNRNSSKPEVDGSPGVCKEVTDTRDEKNQSIMGPFKHPFKKFWGPILHI